MVLAMTWPLRTFLCLLLLVPLHGLARDAAGQSVIAPTRIEREPASRQPGDGDPVTQPEDPAGMEVPLPATANKPRSFVGIWNSTFGKLVLRQVGNRVSGDYPLGTITGNVIAGRLEFEYVESQARGEGWFRLSQDGVNFVGQWRQNGTADWRDWSGTLVSAAIEDRGFIGLWGTTYGRMRLLRSGDDIRGCYEVDGGFGTINGQLKGKRMVFRYTEADDEGAGWFELDQEGQRVSGKYRPDGDKVWRAWQGIRQPPRTGRMWLVVLEAHWENDLAEREYAFGDMLRSYFTMADAKHVDVRHRYFHDLADFRRFSQSIHFLAEPVVLVVSSHGSPAGIWVGGQTIDAATIADCLKYADNLRLLHLSGCAMMAGSVPRQIHEKLPGYARYPISGYQKFVAWDASALGDFTFLSFVLLRQRDPVLAVEQAIRVSPYIGSQSPSGSDFEPLGLTIVAPPDAPQEESPLLTAP